jgi:hypothetical protein
MPSWKTGLVNAFPTPDSHLKRYTSNKNGLTSTSTEVTSLVSSIGTLSLTGGPFPFFRLPAEIRNRIYALVLTTPPTYRLDSEGRLRPTRTSMMRVNQDMHRETSYLLYSSLTVRIFPLQDFVQVPTIMELRPMYRAMVTKLEVVVGPSWTNPPKSWRVSKLLSKRLAKLQNIHSLRVFVQLDPSLPMYEKYRISPTFYTDFCGELLRDVLVCMTQVTHVEIDGNPSVEATGPLTQRLMKEAEEKGKKCTMGRTQVVERPEGVKRLFT